MPTIRLNQGIMQRAVKQAVAVLRKGGVIVYPTETAYGLGADAYNAEAVKKLRSVKQEPAESPISVIVADLQQAKRIAKIDHSAEKLIAKFMPGPLTLVVEKKKKVPNELSGKTIAFRISSNKFATALCKEFGSAITATSANIHGKPAIYNGDKAIKEFLGKVDLVIDVGKLPKCKVSTIYDVGKGKILREGKIKERQIKKAFWE